MTRPAPVARVLMLGCCFFAAAAIAASALRPEIAPFPDSLDRLSPTIGTWTGRSAPDFSPEVLAALGVDAYVNRIYESSTEPPIAVYVGYYESQRTGDTIHSPQNCLPGAGWLPVRTARITLTVAGRPSPVTINRLLIQKGLERQLVLYWYQSRGRVVASDYWSKAYLVWDAARHHRSDAAMVRIVTPLAPTDRSEDDAAARAAAFVETLLPALDQLLPA